MERPIDSPASAVAVVAARHPGSAHRREPGRQDRGGPVPAARFDGLGWGPVSREVTDAFTGEVRFTADDVDEGAARGFITEVTDTSYLGVTDDGQEFFGKTARGSGPCRPPGDCQLMIDTGPQTALAAGMLLSIACGTHDPLREFTEFRYVLVDAKTGDVR